MAKFKRIANSKRRFRTSGGAAAPIRAIAAAFQPDYGSREPLDVINCRKPGDSLGVQYTGFLDAVGIVEAGLPFAAIGRFQRASGLTLERIKQVAHLSEGSFARRKRTGRLSPEESERMLRVARLFERATALHDGDQDAARQWLETSIPSLSNRRPLDLARTEPGAREVENLIGRIEHGVVS